MQKWLFVCSKNKLRRPTGEAVFATHLGLGSAGLDHRTRRDTGVVL